MSPAIKKWSAAENCISIRNRAAFSKDDINGKVLLKPLKKTHTCKNSKYQSLIKECKSKTEARFTSNWTECPSSEVYKQ